MNSAKNYLRTSLGIGLVLNFLIWGVIYLKVEPKVEPVFLEYSIYFGVSRIGQWWEFYTFPLIGLAVFLLNSFLGFFIFKKKKVLGYLLLIVACLVQTLLLMQVILLILLNPTY